MARDLLDDSSSEEDTDGAFVGELKVNEEFAKRFEYNKKREELAQLEEKHGKDTRKRKRNDEESDSESSTDSEDEDDMGELATTTLDSEIQATLNAIRSKDPRVYDGKTTFYTDAEREEQASREKEEKPMYLRDYHRENLLNGIKPDDEDQPITYDQEQETLRKELVNAMHAEAESEDETDLLVAKKRQRPVQRQVEVDVKNAEKDPENFLSNFMAARAWVPTEKATYQPFESDDEEEERRAEEFEEAYNMRFEDPTKSNERLRTHARDMAARYSVRRDEKTPRQKKRDEEKEKKEQDKQQRKQEKDRLRKLRIEEVEEKVKKIKQAAGLRSDALQPEDWADFVDGDWNDADWEQEMQQRFGDKYYADQDVPSDEEISRKKPKKPKFEDDIDINDIIPDFKVEDDAEFSLSDEEPKIAKKDHKKAKEQKKKDSRKERRIIEQLVDDQLKLELHDSLPGKSKTVGFRYRETSPQSFGLSSRDILLAEDTQLNQFAGLKKLAAFRDPEKKNKDRKHLGKKARLRKWRKDTFGNEDGLQDSELIPQPDQMQAHEDGVNIVESGKKKRRRAKKHKVEHIA